MSDGSERELDDACASKTNGGGANDQEREIVTSDPSLQFGEAKPDQSHGPL